MLIQLLNDESGFVVSTEMMLVSVILVIGMIVGQATLRDQVVTELADAADAVSAIDQSYLTAAVSVTDGGGTVIGSVAGTAFADVGDFCDDSDSGQQGLSAAEGACILVDGGLDGAGVDNVIAVGSDSP